MTTQAPPEAVERGLVCPCGRPRHAGRVVCAACYHAAPLDLRVRLDSPVSRRGAIRDMLAFAGERRPGQLELGSKATG